MFSDLKWMSFPERVIYMKAIQLFKTIRGDAPEYLRSSFTFASDIHDCFVHRLISSCILQNLIYLHFQVPFHNIFKIQIHFTILKHSIYVGLIPNDQGQL